MKTTEAQKATVDIAIPTEMLPRSHAAGATADIYTLANGTVLKLFHGGRSLASPEHEAHVAGAVSDAIPAAGQLSVPARWPDT